MPLKYGYNWAELAAPAIRQFTEPGKAAAGDWKTRRTRIEVLFGKTGAVNFPPEIEHIVHHAEAEDGHQVAIHHVPQRVRPSTGKCPATVHVYGGGYFSCSAASMVAAMGMYVSKTRVRMLSIEYRLAPENPFPVPLEDC